jgi:hypothetical protein
MNVENSWSNKNILIMKKYINCLNEINNEINNDTEYMIIHEICASNIEINKNEKTNI